MSVVTVLVMALTCPQAEDAHLYSIIFIGFHRNVSNGIIITDTDHRHDTFTSNNTIKPLGSPPRF